MRDFTHEKYKLFCKNLNDCGYEILNVRDYLQSRQKSNTLIMRHDVDSKPNFALKLARIENQMNIKSTYYFRYVDGVFDPQIIRAIHELGHEIGYHYEVLSKTNGDFEKAIRLFEYELNDLRRICEIDTICMHGKTLSRYDNRDIWKIYDFSEFGIIGEAYLSMRSITDYFSDTGLGWNPKYKLRDRMPNMDSGPSIETTDDLIDYILINNSKIIYILFHPENWSDNPYDWWTILAINKAYNSIKKILKLVRDY